MLGGVPVYVPTIVSRTAQLYNAAATSMVITLPTRQAGDRLVVCINRSSASSDAIAKPADWTALTATGTTSSFCAAYYLDVTSANKDDASATWSGGTSTRSSSYIWLLRGHDPGKAPESNAGAAQNTATSTSYDPASLTPSYGSHRYAWLSFLGIDRQAVLGGGTPCVTAWPSGFGNTATQSTDNGADVTAGVGDGACDLISVASSIDPSAYTYNTAGTGGRSVAITIAVPGT